MGVSEACLTERNIRESWPFPAAIAVTFWTHSS